MTKRLTILIAALALSLSATASWAGPGCGGSACSGKTAKTDSTKAAPASVTSADHNTQPLGGADEKATAEAKSDTKSTEACCPEGEKVAADGAACCPEGKKTAAAKGECPMTKAACAEKVASGECSGDKAACAEKVASGECSGDKAACAEACAEKVAAGECPMGGKKAGLTADANAATPKVVPGGGEATGKAKAAPADASQDKKAYKVGSKVAPFELTNAKTGKTEKLTDLAGKKATALIFWNQECPYVVEVQDRVAEFQKAYGPKGINVVAIDAGVNNPAESVKKHAADKPFAVLINPDTTLAAQFAATRTPEVFLLDADGVIQYHGAFDSGKLRDGEARKTYLANAVDQMLKGEKIATTETKAFGCGLKYAEGVAPLK